MQKAAELDVRPNIAGNYRIKFKAEALPLKDQVGGYRLLYSHNAQFPLSQAPEGDRTSMVTLARVFPALTALKTSDTDRVELVNHTIVEEVLKDLGVLDFGKGVTPSRTSLSGASGTLITHYAASLHSRPSSSAGTSCTKRRWTAVGSSSLRCSSPAVTGSLSARPRPGSSIGSKEIHPRAMSDMPNGLQWKDAPRGYGPHKTLYNRFIRWSRLGVFDRILAALAGEGPKPERIMIDAPI